MLNQPTRLYSHQRHRRNLSVGVGAIGTNNPRTVSFKSITLLMMMALVLVLAENEADVCTKFNFTIYTDGVKFNTSQALVIFDSMSLEYLQSEFEAANLVQVSVTGQNSVETSSQCEEIESVTNNKINYENETQDPHSMDQPFLSQPSAKEIPSFAESWAVCSRADSTICMKADASLDEQLVVRLSLVKVRLFISDFNRKHEDQIFIHYDYPVPVRASAVIALMGADQPMNQVQKGLFLYELSLNLQPILHRQGLEDTALSIFLQTALVEERQERQQEVEKEEEQNGKERRQKSQGKLGPRGVLSYSSSSSPLTNSRLKVVRFEDLATLEQGDEIEGNQVQIMINAFCRKDCTGNYLRSALTSANVRWYIQNEMLTNLQNLEDENSQTRALSTEPEEEDIPRYFELAERIIYTENTNGGGLVNVNSADQTLQKILQGLPEYRPEPQEIIKVSITRRIWILVGVSVSVMVWGCMFAVKAIRRRKKKNLIRLECTTEIAVGDEAAISNLAYDERDVDEDKMNLADRAENSRRRSDSASSSCSVVKKSIAPLFENGSDDNCTAIPTKDDHTKETPRLTTSNDTAAGNIACTTSITFQDDAGNSETITARSRAGEIFRSRSNREVTQCRVTPTTTATTSEDDEDNTSVSLGDVAAMAFLAAAAFEELPPKTTP